MASAGTGLSTVTNVSTTQYLAVGITLTLITTAGVALRFVANRRMSKNRIDDYLALLATIFLAISLALTYRLAGLLTSTTTTASQLIQWSRITNWFTTFTLWTSKAPILLLYIHLFGIKTWVRIVCYTTLAIIGAVDLAGGAAVSTICDPRGGPIDAKLILKCADASAITGIILGIVSVITDGLILILPLPIIYHLKLSLRRRINIGLVFATGAIAIAVSALSVSYKYSGLHGSSAGLTDASLSFLAECAIAIAVSCAPAIHSCWSKFVISSSLYSKITSALSQRSLVRSDNRSGVPDSAELGEQSKPKFPKTSYTSESELVAERPVTFTKVSSSGRKA